MPKKDIKYVDYVDGGEISLTLTANSTWRFSFERVDSLTRKDLYIIRNLFEDVIEEQGSWNE